MKLILSTILAAFLCCGTIAFPESRWDRFEREHGSPWNRRDTPVQHLITDTLKCHDTTIRSTISDMLNNLSTKASGKKLRKNVVLKNTFGKALYLNEIWNDFRDELYRHELAFAGCMRTAKTIEKSSCENIYATSISDVLSKFSDLMTEKSPELFAKIEENIAKNCGQLKEEMFIYFIA